MFQAECVGIILAADAIATRKVKGYNIRILSDSKAVLQALSSHTMTSGLIYECYERLAQVSTQNSIVLQWIKGHSGSRGNDAADELAKKGSDTKVHGPEPMVPIPFNLNRSLVRDHVSKTHNTTWASGETCR